ncbi:hypothetical protein [Winogradskyella sp. SYSU M77433]|uniref:hypothetical protein n=1 Tax=Winogradskyella sp. SYSU M77433 TaxID=3042722 RepID=UPI0024803057|nr:hypothetical protein [Winogradskyella sp. SYSU M77433]MDH7913691.1 hypothetical protein [Winogradskyella sp. SYSU M77433]
MKLTKENIKFIDTYLENSNIIHIDIRMEMLDHIASVIETKMENGDKRDFYFIFKDYMVDNKNSLLNNNKSFIKDTDRRLTKSIFHELFNWPCILTFFALYILFQNVNKIFGINNFRSWLAALPLIGFVIFGIYYYIKVKRSNLRRFSALERLGLIYAMSFNLFHLCWNVAGLKSTNTSFVLYVMTSFALTLLIAMTIVSKKMIYEFQNRFKSLV